ncbi:hypothetical protein AOL_s00169g110 [Orbilia oligospora ATCC 24927]|uniref:Rhodopsin domain-containing protein n=1 Tax=Arthrobotrys oligospora (strain ATCC 24927 / CBS 115.81 / DSM 1491) TaxID=756982 RepID=G1XMQ7_ARTOA|nr:hypothetical protein AOL_s00169g110 [Orbilia oligospora ATCC 24927]EGX45504.1 hypothetical protein AOL_s00169g110 [Orbilia oligospora ATCC 24927]
MGTPVNLTKGDLDLAASITINLGFLARNFYDTRTIDVISAFAGFYNDTPNATDPEILAFSGARPQDLSLLLQVLGERDMLRDSIFWLDAIRQYLPYTPGTGHLLVPVFAVFTVITTIVLALRLWSRQTIAGGIRGYDWIMVFGYFMTLVYSASALYHAVNINISSQFWGYSWNEIARQQMFYIVLDILYPIAALIIKSSLLLFYYSLFSGRYLRLSVWATFGFTLATTMTIILYSIFKCHPVAYWSEWYTSECDSHQKIPYLVTGSFMILSDVIIWVLPLPMVLKLQLYRREKIAAIFTFSLGIFACIASIFRLQAVHKYFFTSAGTGKTPIINTWTIVELNLAIICASAPALRALCIRHAPKLLSYGSNGTDSSSNSSNNSNNNSGNGSMNERNRKNTKSVHGRVIVHHDQIRPSDLASLRSGISRTGSGWSDVEKSVHYSSTSRIGSPV